MTSRSETVRALDADDFEGALDLYRELVGDIPVPSGGEGRERFAEILEHPGTTILGAERDERIVSMATLHLLPNMTFGGRPYALVENVVTLKSMRGRGAGSRVMEAVADRAWAAGAYKIMLLTGREIGARGFYEKLGYTAGDKHAMTLRRAPKRRPRD